jgi:hypothetical protein
MNSRPVALKSVTLCLRGFELTSQQVESIVGIAASGIGNRGEPVKPGVKTLLKRSYVSFSLEFAGGCRLDEMIPALLANLGGAAHLCEVRDQVAPEFFEFDIFLPIKGSVEQEGGFLSAATLGDLSLLRATLSFQFV